MTTPLRDVPGGPRSEARWGKLKHQGKHPMAHVSTDEVLSALRTVDFPASKEELIQAAREAGAFDEVICARRAIPPVEYANRNEVARSVPVDRPRTSA